MAGRFFLPTLVNKAIADFTERIRIIPGGAGTYNNRGLSYQELGDADKAAADFAKAKELGYQPEEEKPLTSSARPSLRSQAARPRPPAGAAAALPMTSHKLLAGFNSFIETVETSSPSLTAIIRVFLRFTLCGCLDTIDLKCIDPAIL
jgi:tetratricopeptide (TPR) repeat protein